MWDAPDFRVPYDLNFIATQFDHANPIITKLTLAFLNLYQYAKKSVHFINSLSSDTADFRSHPKISHDKYNWNPAKYLKQYFFLIYC